MKNGSFKDVIETVVAGTDRADFHGGAWADFDNDGDQDLLLISGGASGRGYSPNFLYVNQEGPIKERRGEMGRGLSLWPGTHPAVVRCGPRWQARFTDNEPNPVEKQITIGNFFTNRERFCFKQFEIWLQSHR